MPRHHFIVSKTDDRLAIAYCGPQWKDASHRYIPKLVIQTTPDLFAWAWNKREGESIYAFIETYRMPEEPPAWDILCDLFPEAAVPLHDGVLMERLREALLEGE